MFSTFIILALLVLSVVAFIVRNFDGIPVWMGGIVGIFAALVLTIFSCTATVDAKQIGVVTTFKKPSDETVGAGLHLKAPWQKITEIDATTQTNEYHGDNAIKVILVDKNTADISATIRWAVNPEKAHDVFAQFRDRDNSPVEELRKAVVSTQFKAAMNSVFNSYDATDEKPRTPNQMADEVLAAMQAKTDELVNIKSITISYIKPDEAVQRKIDALQTQRGATKVAEEKKTTAEKEAAANKILADSISNDPNILVNKCLDLIADGFKPPAGFSCWGSGSSVVIPSAK